MIDTLFNDINILYLIYIMPFITQLGIPLGITFYIMYIGSTITELSSLISFILTLSVCFITENVIADIIGKKYGNKPLNYIEKKFSLKKSIKKSKQLISDNAIFSIFFTRTIFLGGAPIINYLLGINNYSKKKFIFYVSLAEILFVTIFSTIGYLFSDMWEILSLLLEDISYAITLLILLGIIVGITYYKNNDSEK